MNSASQSWKACCKPLVVSRFWKPFERRRNPCILSAQKLAALCAREVWMEDSFVNLSPVKGLVSDKPLMRPPRSNGSVGPRAILQLRARSNTTAVRALAHYCARSQWVSDSTYVSAMSIVNRIEATAAPSRQLLTRAVAAHRWKAGGGMEVARRAQR